MAAVDEVLAELGLATKPSLTIVNKVDRVAGGDGVVRQMGSEGGIPISARLGTGTERLLRRVDEALRATRLRCRLLVPYDRAGVVSSVYARGQVLRREDGADGIRLDVEIPRALAGLVESYREETVGVAATGGHARVAAGR